jgi:hypothetical protein
MRFVKKRGERENEREVRELFGMLFLILGELGCGG